jgi:hypothetical protein
VREEAAAISLSAVNEVKSLLDTKMGHRQFNLFSPHENAVLLQDLGSSTSMSRQKCSTAGVKNVVDSNLGAEALHLDGFRAKETMESASKISASHQSHIRTLAGQLQSLTRHIRPVVRSSVEILGLGVTDLNFITRRRIISTIRRHLHEEAGLPLWNQERSARTSTDATQVDTEHDRTGLRVLLGAISVPDTSGMVGGDKEELSVNDAEPMRIEYYVIPPEYVDRGALNPRMWTASRVANSIREQIKSNASANHAPAFFNDDSWGVPEKGRNVVKFRPCGPVEIVHSPNSEMNVFDAQDKLHLLGGYLQMLRAVQEDEWSRGVKHSPGSS